MSAEAAVHLDSDRLVELSRGAPASEGEAGHLASCPECRTEIEMVSAASRLGRDRLPALDTDRIASEVRRRLTAEPSRRPAARIWWLGGLAAAALAVFALRSAVTPVSEFPGPGVPPVPVMVSVLHELDELDEQQLEAVLHSLPPATGELDHVDRAPLSDLDAADLERMLRSMEE
jgi:hypothetical protein